MRGRIISLVFMLVAFACANAIDSDPNYDPDSLDFALRLFHANLLLELGEKTEFEETWDDIKSIRDWWLECQENEARPIDAYVLQVHEHIRDEGVRSAAAQFPEEVDNAEPFDEAEALNEADELMSTDEEIAEDPGAIREEAGA